MSGGRLSRWLVSAAWRRDAFLPSSALASAQTSCARAEAGRGFATSSAGGEETAAAPSTEAKEEGAELRRSGSHVATKEYLDQVRWRIFGSYPGNGLRSGRKVLRKNLIGDKVLAWYPQTETYGKPHRGDKLWVDPDLLTAKERLERYQRRGKGPPKKGEGKRASRKK